MAVTAGFPTDFDLQNEEYARLSSKEKLAFLEREMERNQTYPLPPRGAPVSAQAAQVLGPAEAAAAGAAGAAMAEVPYEIGNFVTNKPPAASLRKPNVELSGTVAGALGRKLDQPASPEWWQSTTERMDPGVRAIAAGDKVRGFDSIVQTARAIDPDFAPPGPLETGYRELYGLDAKNSIIPPGQLPPQVEGTQEPAKDPFKEFLKGMQEAFNFDQGQPAGLATSTALSGPRADEVNPDIQAARDDLKRSRSRLEMKIDEMAKGSTLPEPVFKDRLASVLVGLALGYAGEYSRSGDYGKGIVAGLASGGASGLQYNKDVERRKDRVRLENLASQRSAIQMEGQLHTSDAANVRTEQTNALYSERTRALQLNSIRQAEATLRKAQIEQRNPLALMNLAFKTIETKMAFNKMANPQLETQVILPNGTKVKIGDMDPGVQQAWMDAKNAPSEDPDTFNAALFQADKIIEAGGGKWDLRAIGGSPETQRYVLADMLLSQHYLGKTNVFEGIAQEE
jgi:hypothetical protein